MPEKNKQQLKSNQSLEKLRTKLLDLTARNPLINHKHTNKNSLKLITENQNKLVEQLLSEVECCFKSVPEPVEQNNFQSEYIEPGFTNRSKDKISAEDWAKKLGIQTNYETPINFVSETKNQENNIQTLLFPNELELRLKNLLQSSELAMQEMGANILYLAFGFLEWYENSTSDSVRLAPLYLMPVRLKKGRLNSTNKTYNYTLIYSGEDIIPNLSLREKLKFDFSIEIPDLDENTTPEDYFNELNLIINTQPRWKIRRYTSLTLLNFSKLLMYLDLDPQRWPENDNIINHPVVSKFLSGYDVDEDTDQSTIGNIGFNREYKVDEVEKIHEKYPLIDSADSSQHSALIDVLDGKNIVIEGPPGTGKSQTITNLIAASMSQGKKVLFVAEKLAALEVVRTRLNAVGLGDFCLELHSHKSQKTQFLSDLDVRLKNNGNYRNPKDIKSEIENYEISKEKLKKYAEKINTPWKKTNKSPHDIFTISTRYKLETYKSIIGSDKITLKNINGNNYDSVTQRKHEEQILSYKKSFCDIKQVTNSTIEKHPWYGIYGIYDLSNLNQVKNSLEKWNLSLQELNQTVISLYEYINANYSSREKTFEDIIKIEEKLKKIPVLKNTEKLNLVPVLQGELLKNTNNYMTEFEEIHKRINELSKKLNRNTISKILTTEDLISQLFKSVEVLKNQLNPIITISEIENVLVKINTIQNQLEQLKESLQSISVVMDSPVKKFFTFSENGLIEFKTIIEIIGYLSAADWKHINEMFDNEEMDDFLPQLKMEIENIIQLKEQINNIFNLNLDYNKEELCQLEVTLNNGGTWRWFKSDWRNARKKLLSYSTNNQKEFSFLFEHLAILIEFISKKESLECNKSYISIFKHHLNGIETDVALIEKMRTWYKIIRKQYGFGLGQKFIIGDAILNLPLNISKSIRLLIENNIQEKINSLLIEISDLKKLLLPIKNFHFSNVDLHDGSEHSFLSNLKNILNQNLKTIKLLSVDSALSLNQIEDITHNLQSLSQKIAFNEDLLSKLIPIKSHFDFKINIQLDPVLENNNVLNMSNLKNTIFISTFIHDDISNDDHEIYLYLKNNVSDKNVFHKLSDYSKKITQINRDEVETRKHFFSSADIDYKLWTLQTKNNIINLISRNKFAIENKDLLPGWATYIQLKNKIDSLGIENFSNIFEYSNAEIDKIESIYKAIIFDALSREIIIEDADLAYFSSYQHESIIEQFKEVDDNLKKLQCEYIAWKIDQHKIPSGVTSARTNERTERALLEHECSKKKRHLPIRQLMQRSGNAISALKPCFMMGPMSVAQYLGPGKIHFDLIVMDEASQIKPQDALGAIARGKQLVVVGDPKQLPPTNFFERIVEELDEDTTSIEESESILDATISMFPARRLRWHYRSQHESLIAFSNQSFYDNDLVIFPSPYKKENNYGIQYKYLKNGCFSGRKNIEEANVITTLVREHFLNYPQETLGVVAMNVEQRDYIEKSIELLSKTDPIFQNQLEINSNGKEPFFIKNLENVQGDERDVIIVSLTYGPAEPSGKVHQRFGPINSDSGWRRLNVLFTRSKKKMSIISSMNSSDIVISPNSKKGVHSLREFLSYCETGILHKTVHHTGREPDSDFEIAVMSALHYGGFDCVPQVGVAGFFIDLAVIDPGNPGRYLMGIECDGATYHSAKSTRDRDKLRQAILEKLGWRIRRIWSTDWFKNPKKEIDSILNELNELKTNKF